MLKKHCLFLCFEATQKLHDALAPAALREIQSGFAGLAFRVGVCPLLEEKSHHSEAFCAHDLPQA